MPFDLLGLAPQKTKEGQLANKAADWLEDHGWCQDAYFLRENNRPEGQIKGACLVGAIYAVMGGGIDEGRPTRGVIARRAGFENIGHALRWNDEPGRTKEEVIARLRAVP